MSMRPAASSDPSTKYSPPSGSDSGVSGRRQHAFRAGLAVGAAVAIAVVLLIVQNGESAQIDWLFFHFKARLWLILVLTLVAAGVTWELAKTSVRRSRHHLRNRRAAQKSPT